VPQPQKPKKVWLKPWPKTSSQDTWPLETAAAVIKYETVGQTVNGFAFLALRNVGQAMIQYKSSQRKEVRRDFG